MDTETQLLMKLWGFMVEAPKARRCRAEPNVERLPWSEARGALTVNVRWGGMKI